VVGEIEKASATVNVRTRDNKVHGEIEIDKLIQKFQNFKETKARSCEENF
jgi:threonyl-tRNA synthetase